jgi:hypothetical protein
VDAIAARVPSSGVGALGDSPGAGKAGTVVRGTLHVDDFVDSLQFLSGSQLVAIPYAYTIG